MKRTRKLISILLALCFIVAALPIHISANEPVTYPESYKIYPTLHSIVYNDGGVTLADVNLVVTNSADAPTKAKIESILTNNAVAFEKSAEISASKLNIVLGIAGDNEAIGNAFTAAAFADTSALTKTDGYVIGMKDNTIFIMGKSAIALFYGVTTFKQMVDFGVNVRNVLINDYADNGFRGLVEGFYGIPYSFEMRKSTIEMMGEYKMNSYMYGPKDDPYHHGAQWRELYPEKELADLKALVEAANANNVSFVWTIHAGPTMDFTDDDDAVNATLPEIISPQWMQSTTNKHEGVYVAEGQHAIDLYSAEESYQSIIAKYEQLYSIGVRQFGFFADDISFPQARFSAKAIVPFVNRINREFIQAKGDVKPLIFCPTYYHRADINYNGRPYMQTINGLDASIELMYTGANTMSNVDGGSSNNGYFTSLMSGRKPLIWWNYPVTDYIPSYLLMGQTPGLNANALNTMTGVVANPMQQGFASQIPLFGVADYTWKVQGYNANQAWQDSFKYLFPEVADSLYLFSQNSTLGTTSTSLTKNTESVYLQPKLTAFRNAVSKSTDLVAPGTALIEEYDKLIAAIADIKANCKSEGLLADIMPWLNKMESIAVGSKAVINGFLASNVADAWGYYSIASAEEASWPSITVDQLGGGKVAAVTGTGYLTPFFTDMKTLLETSINGKIDADKLTMIMDDYTNVTLSDVITLGHNRFIGMKLGNVYKISEIIVDLTVDVFDKLTIQYSANGVEWITAEGTVTNNVFTASLDSVAARYMRVINNTVEDVVFSYTKMAMRIVTPVVYTATGESNTKIYQTNTPARLVDGNFTTPYWVDGNQVPDQSVTLTYAQPFNLYDFALYEDTGDYIRSGGIYASMDNENWTRIGDIGTNFTAEKVGTTTYNVVRGFANGLEVKYIKIVTESTANNWTKLFEFVVNDKTGAKTSTVPAFNIVASGVPASMLDRSVATAFTTTSGESYLQYDLSENTNADTITIMQNAQNISNATVSIRSTDGWAEVGVLDQAVSIFDVSAYPNLLAIKFTWADNGVVPKIHEMFTKSNGVDKAALVTAIADANAALADDYLPAVYASLSAACVFGQAVVDTVYSSRSDVKAATDAINALLPQLRVKAVKIDGSSLVTVKKGKTTSISATIAPANAYNKEIVWKSSNEAVATIDENGLIVAKTTGMVMVTVTTVESGYTYNIVVRVTA